MSDESNYSAVARISALVLALIVAATLALRVYLRMGEDGSLFGAVSYLTQFFTILTNALVMVVMGLIAMRKAVHVGVLGAIIIAIAGVGVIYHILLAHLWEPQGLVLLADFGVHTLVPLCAVVWWLVFGQKPEWRLLNIPFWVAWPLTYCAYALLRGAFSGFYPYPFLNVPNIGWSALAINVVALTVGFMILGGLLTALKRFLPSRV